MAETVPYVPRLADRLIADLLAELPAVAIVGPRATGKTTTAARHARTIIRLDRPAEALAVAADPDAVLHGLDEPILLDEWQEVPQVLGAVKRACDTAPPGQVHLDGIGASRDRDRDVARHRACDASGAVSADSRRAARLDGRTAGRPDR